MPNAYTFTLTDTGNRISASIEAQITACANYVIGLVSHYIDWQGTLDFTVDIQPASASPYPDINGILPSISQITWDGTGWVNETLEECITGTDTDTSRPDAGCTIYLAADGSIKNYDTPVWFDPNPQFGVDPAVPAGTHDFVGIYTHEIFHALGFYNVTRQWQEHITTQDGISYFDGPNTIAYFGGALPFAMGSDHYAVPVHRGLMYEFGNYERNRFDIGRIDLAVLADLGHTIKTYEGLSLFEMIDTQLTLAGTAGDDTLYGDYHGNRLNGGEGGDVLDGGVGADTLDGGAGNDVIYVKAGDQIVDLIGDGFDNVLARGNYTLNAGAYVEILSTTSHGGTQSINLAGNSLNNVVIGNAGSNILDGGGGADRLQGLGGDDYLIVDSMDDFVDEPAGGGYDNLLCRADYVLTTDAEIEVISTDNHSGTASIDIRGSAFGQVIIGNAGDNILDGGGGADRLAGLGGNDFLIVDSMDDYVDETSGGGYDNLICRNSYVLTGNAEIEVISTDNHGGTQAIDITGSGFGQVIIGNAGSNILIGGGGSDRLAGLGGNDFLFVDSMDDFVDEEVNGGYDNLICRNSYVLTGSAEIEVISTDNHGGTAAIDITGSAYNQVIIGNAGNNVLDGSFGHDRLAGLGGADSYAFSTNLSNFNIDTIDGFDADDTILLENAIFTGLAAGGLNPNAFVNGTAAADADDRIIYDAATGRLFFDADGSGSGNMLHFATLENHFALTASDFTVI